MTVLVYNSKTGGRYTVKSPLAVSDEDVKEIEQDVCSTDNVKQPLERNPSHAPFYADFISWVEESEKELSKRLLDAVKADKLSDAKDIAAEASIYKNLRHKITTEMRERQSQIRYDETQIERK